jgi:Holliday junction DNA helicase RuvA
MIASINGRIIAKTSSSVVLEASGIGWRIMVAPSTSAELPAVGGEAMLYISESTAMYGGGTTLYGFASVTEQDIFALLRDVPQTGAKKALEYLDKIKKSPPDFKKAVENRDVPSLTTIFGFKKPTAEKMITALKQKIESLDLGAGRPDGKVSGLAGAPSRSEALAVLIALGYREGAARSALDEAVSSIISSGDDSSPDAQRMVRAALKFLF